MTVVVRSLLSVSSAALLLFAWAPWAHAQSQSLEALAKEVEVLKQGQAGILKEIQEIKALIVGARQAAQQREQGVPQGTLVSLADAPFKGGKEARVTIVEFSDYQCPFCARHVKNTLPQLEKEYVASGKLKYVFRDSPIENLHPQAPKAHEAARCAGEQGKYWPMHNVLFDKQRSLSVDDLTSHAKGLGLDAARFRTCLDSNKFAEAVRADQVQAAKFGVRGTPTFLVGRTEPDGTHMKVTATIVGAQPYARFKDAIDAALAPAADADSKR
jgi:protein-disulfide isomerase